MKNNEEMLKSLDIFINLCKAKGFHMKTAEALAIMGGSKESHAVYGTTKNAYDYLCKLAKKYDDEQRLIDEFVGSLNLQY